MKKILCILIILTSCNLLKESEIKLSSNKKEFEDIKFKYLFFNAQKEKILGNYDEAISYFNECIKINPSESTPYYELASLYEYLGDYNRAYEFSKKAVELNPNNFWYYILETEILRQNKQYEEAANVFELLSKKYPDKISVYFDWAMTLLYAGKFNKAIDVYNKIEDKIGITEDISLQKEKIYLQLGDLNGAVNEIKKLINEFPNEVKYYLILGDIYLANDHNDEAIKYYDKALKIDSSNANLHLSLANYYKQNNEFKKSFVELKKAFSSPSLDIDTKVSILLNYYAISKNKNDLKEQAYDLCKILIKTHPKEAKSYSIYGDFLYRDKKLQEAKKEYLKAIELEPNKFALWQQILAIDSELKQFSSMRKDATKALEYFPSQAVLYLYQGIGYFQEKNYQNAIESFNTGLIYSANNKNLKELFYANLGDAYYQVKKYEISDSSYAEALKINPNNSHVLNNYAYYLSLRKINLDSAYTMAKKAVGLEPSNSSFLDTYGWVLYQKKKFEQAKEMIEKAIENGGDKNPVILEHMGDVLFQLGEKEKAIKFWMQAKDKGSNSSKLDKKIKEKKLYE